MSKQLWRCFRGMTISPTLRRLQIATSVTKHQLCKWSILVLNGIRITNLEFIQALGLMTCDDWLESRFKL